MKQKISELARAEWQSCEESSTEITKDYSYNQSQTIRRIEAYINDRYFEGDQDRLFWNLSTPRIPHFAKNIDVDTKDFRPKGKGDANFFQAWVLSIRFKKWARESGLALTLNDLSEGLATYGSVIIKKVPDVERGKGYKLEEVNLQNIAFDPTVKTIRDSNFKVEKHYLSEGDIRARAGIWDNIEEAIEKGEQVESKEATTDHTTVPTYLFYQRVGEVYDEDKDEYILKNVIFTGYGDNEVVVYEEEIDKKEDPYYDLHVGRYRGRWLRMGIVERLFRLQERVNALVNQNAKTTEIASLLLLRTQDPNTSGNVLSALESGEIITSADLQQIAIDNRFLNSFVQEMGMLERQADRLCLTPEVITGDTIPSQTPFRGVAVMNNNAKSTFKYYKQAIWETFAKILLDEILPDEVRSWNHGDMLEIAENEMDIQIYDNLLLNKKLWERMNEYFMKTKKLPNSRQLQELAMRLVQEFGKEDRRLEVPKGFFNFKYGIEIKPTDETEDKATLNDAIDNALNWVIANPDIINNPMFRQKLEENGINPPRFDNNLMKPLPTQQPQPQGQQVRQSSDRDVLLKEVVK